MLEKVEEGEVEVRGERRVGEGEEEGRGGMEVDEGEEEVRGGRRVEGMLQTSCWPWWNVVG